MKRGFLFLFDLPAPNLMVCDVAAIDSYLESADIECSTYEMITMAYTTLCVSYSTDLSHPYLHFKDGTDSLSNPIVASGQTS